MRTVIDFLRHWAGIHPDKTVFAFRDLHGDVVDSLTYRQLDRRSNFLAAKLSSVPGIEAGKPVLLACHPGLAVIEGLLACAKIGAIAVPVPPISLSAGVTGIERLAAVAENCGATTVLADRRQHNAVSDMIARRRDGTAAAVASRFEWLDLSSMTGEAADFPARPNDLLFLQYTSGSTRQPRGVMVSHANVIDNRPAEIGQQTVCVSWLPHYHDMGLIGYFLFPLVSGGSAHILSTLDFMRRPALWLETITHARATNTSAPDFGYSYCLRPDKVPDDALAGVDLSSLVDMMNASEPAHPETIRAFARRFAACGLDPAVLTVAYGLAENTLRVSVGGRTHLAVSKEHLARGIVQVVRRADNHANIQEVASCGRPIDGTDLRIVDPESGRELPPGVAGEIWVSGPGTTVGYWGMPALSETTFRARLDRGDGRTFLRTGDIGFVQDGDLYISGRLRDMVVLRGRNIFPTDVEGAIEARFPAIESGRVAVFGAGDGTIDQSGLIVLVEAGKGESPVALADIHRYVVSAFQSPVHAVALVRRGAIRKTSSGKIARSRCSVDYHDGGIDIVELFSPAAPDVADGAMDEHLDSLVYRAGVASGDETTIADLGLDSIELVELSIQLEDLARRSGLAEIHRLNTIYDLRLLQAATVGQIKHLVGELVSGATPVHIMVDALENAVRDVANSEAGHMRADSRLDPALLSSPPAQSLENGKILLTGATGFLGSFLVEALLRLTDAPVVVLVRAQNRDHGRRRMLSALTKTGLSDEAARNALNRRIEVVCGDVTQTDLGLAPADRARLTHEVTRVFHSAAEVDYRKTFAELRPANVRGTEEIIRFCAEGAAKQLNHISTTFVFGWTDWTIKAEAERNAGMTGLNFGYSQSKWVSEQLVHEAGSRGLPVRIFRPSLISASQSGHFLRTDITSRLFGYAMRHGVSVRTDKQLSLVPVETCATNIVAIAATPASVGRTFHLTSNAYNTMETVCRAISALYGYRFTYVDIDGFVDHVNRHCRREDDLFPLKPFINTNRDKLKDLTMERYDNRNYRMACAASALAVAEPPLEDTVSWLVDFLIANGLVPPPPTHPAAVRAESVLAALDG